MTSGVQIHRVDLDDRAALERHVALEQRLGHPRFDVDGLARWIPTVPNVVLLAARTKDHLDLGCATASTVPELPGTVNINLMAESGDRATWHALVEELESWGRDVGADTLLAHVSDMPDGQERDWDGAGFTSHGHRVSLERQVHSTDKDLPPPIPDDLVVIPLRDRPELATAALHAWNTCHADIPTVLPFAPVDIDQWQEMLGMSANDPFPPSLLIAVGAADDVVGIAFVNPHDARPGTAAHRFTGVLSQHRGRGIATALKIESIRWAAVNGVRSLRTSNDEKNTAMQLINQRLGYVEQFTMSMFSRTITE